MSLNIRFTKQGIETRRIRKEVAQHHKFVEQQWGLYKLKQISVRRMLKNIRDEDDLKGISEEWRDGEED